MSASNQGDLLLPVISSAAEIRSNVVTERKRSRRVGLVPTMGALHAGHLSLIQAARRECDLVVVSIFVNPTQFGPQEDFQKYPRDLPTDVRLCAEAGADLVYHPTADEVYPPGFTTFVEVEGLSTALEGRFRPGHFRGVATVVLKLFQMVPADVGFFGQKDYQQQTIIRRMVGDLNVPIEIRVCPTVRDPDGLALSSRNIFLSRDERRSALALSQSLQLARRLLSEGEGDLDRIRTRMFDLLTSTPEVRPDYATIADPDTMEEVSAPLPKLVGLVAARVGITRLIDNEVFELGVK